MEMSDGNVNGTMGKWRIRLQGLVNRLLCPVRVVYLVEL